MLRWSYAGRLSARRGTRHDGLLIGALVVLAILPGCESRRNDALIDHETAFDGTAADQMTSVERDALAREANVAQAATEQEPEPAGSGLSGPEVYYGGDTGHAAAAPTHDAVATTVDGGVVLNFVDADIRQVVNGIIGDELGESYTIDPRVQGTITLRTTSALSRGDLLGVLEDVLALNGAAVVKSNGIYQILPLDMAAATPAIVSDYGGERIDRGFGLHVIPLRHAQAIKVEESIKSFVPPGRSLRADPVRNILIFVGSTPEARDIVDLVATFDINWLSTRSYGLFPLKSADPETVIAELRTVFGQQEEGAASDAVQFSLIERLNAILAVSRFPDYIDKVATWVARLDRSLAADEPQIHIYTVQNGRARDLAKVLGQLLRVEVAVAQDASLAPGLVSTTVSSTTGGEDDVGASGRLDEPLDGYDESVEQPGLTAQEPMGGASEQQFTDGPVIAISGGEAIGASQLDGGNVRIVASESDNALVIYATPASYRVIESALQRLDTPPLQTMIEATIIEVTLNDTLRYGVEWFLTKGDSTFRLSSLVTGAVAPAAPGFAYLLDNSDVRLVVNALSRVTDVKVVSAPQLLVLNNEAAQLKVGDQVPIVKKTAVSITDPDAPVVNEVEYRDTGVILNIRPRVNSSGLVSLDIIQEVSDVTATTSSGIDSPTIQQRRIASAVAVNSGETIALGGLIRDTNSHTVSGVPVLSDIPLLGNLFKTTNEDVRRTELLILLKPRVIRDRNDARLISKDIRSRLKALESLSMPEAEPEVLP